MNSKELLVKVGYLDLVCVWKLMVGQSLRQPLLNPCEGDPIIPGIYP